MGISEQLRDQLASQGEDGNPDTSQQTGRSGTGRLRNFKSMNDEKLLGVLADVEREGNDPEALTAVRQEVAGRGL